MKIVYVIYNIKLGKGGHFHSLLETASKVREKENVAVISLGKYQSPVLEKLGEDYYHIKSNTVFFMILEIYKLIKKLKPDILNAFDAQSFFFVRLISNFIRIPVVLTRCGGPNPRNYYPFCKNMVLFSEENRSFFASNNKFSSSNFHVIPNRVPASSYKQDYHCIELIKNKLRPDSLVFLRIARISLAYESSILQSINLVRTLADKGIDAQLVVVGVIEDQLIYSRLKQKSCENIYFFTQDNFTLNSSKLIDVADVVIGTGRSFMEAALRNKIMMVPTSNLDIPDLIDLRNVKRAFSVNFSQRFKSDSESSEIISKFLGRDFNEDEEQLTEFYIQNFSSEIIHKKLMPVYKSATVCDINLPDLIKNAIFLFRYKSTYIKRLFDLIIRMRKSI